MLLPGTGELLLAVDPRASLSAGDPTDGLARELRGVLSPSPSRAALAFRAAPSSVEYLAADPGCLLALRCGERAEDADSDDDVARRLLGLSGTPVAAGEYDPAACALRPADVCRVGMRAARFPGLSGMLEEVTIVASLAPPFWSAVILRLPIPPFWEASRPTGSRSCCCRYACRSVSTSESAAGLWL